MNIDLRAWACCFLWLILANEPDARAQENDASSDFSTCAAYYFLNAHAGPVTDYERLYQAGEHALNRAKMLADGNTAQANFERASSEMMELMNHDWLNFARVEAKFGSPCEGLLIRDADYLD